MSVPFLPTLSRLPFSPAARPSLLNPSGSCACLRGCNSARMPEELLQRVDDVVAAQELGYTSRAEFIKEAVRLRVEAMENLLRERARRG